MKTVIVLSVFTTLFGLASCGGNGQTSRPADEKEYPVLVMSRQDAGVQSVYPATIRGQEDIDVMPRVEGYIEAVYVDEGSAVKAGQALFKINSPSSLRELTSSRASVNSEKAQVNIARLDVDRYRPLAERGIVSKVQLKVYENAYETALASLEQAEAALKNAEATMSWTTVKSPVDGLISTIPYRQGTLVSSASILTTIANTGYIYAYFSLNERKLMDFLDGVEGATQAEKIKNMPPVSLILSDGSEYSEKGKIETITGTVDITTGTANLRAKFSNKAGELRSGTSGKIIIPKTLDNVFIIPQKATFTQQDKILVYKLENDTVKQQLISVAPMPDGQNYAVTGGLSDGDRIVSDGVATLREGMVINTSPNRATAGDPG